MRAYILLFFCAALLVPTASSAAEEYDAKWNSIFSAAIVSAVKQSGRDGVRTTCTDDSISGKSCITTATYISDTADLIVFAFQRDFDRGVNTRFICKYRNEYEVCSSWDDLLKEQCRKKNGSGAYEWYNGVCPVHLF
jgi:hypothetical protein